MPVCAFPAQAGPQSCRKLPTPSTPLEPKVCTVFSAGPVLEQAAGTLGKLGSPIISIGIELAVSPAIFRVAVFTDPQVYPSTNMKHSTMALPVVSVFCGNARDVDKTEEMIRSPDDPVSTSM